MAESASTVATSSPFDGVRRFFRIVGLMRESPVGMVGAFLVGFWILVAVFAPLISPYDPTPLWYHS